MLFPSVETLMKTTLSGIFGFTVLTSATFGASNISPRFDGRYQGDAGPTPGMSRDTCTSFKIGFDVKSGIIQRDSKAPVVFDGFVTDEGFVRGHLRATGRKPLLMEGRITHGLLTAGAMDEAEGCAWILELQQQPLPGAAVAIR